MLKQLLLSARMPNMNKLQTYGLWLFLNLFFNTATFALSGEAYLKKFTKYNEWQQNLPRIPNQDFLNFISGSTPLSQKLREKWLYQLAYDKNWATYTRYYQPSTDVALQCYEQLALYQSGQQQKAIQATQKLWLNGNSQPKLCNQLFALLIKNKEIDKKLIYRRFVLALAANNLPLALYLLKEYSPHYTKDIQLLTKIDRNPNYISQLTPSQLHSEFYLYGLKRMVTKNMPQALQFWQLAKKKHYLNYAQHQDFLAYISLYKAMRGQPDTREWFTKVDPNFYNDTMLGWQIRHALKNKQWRRVDVLIGLAKDKDDPCWQYWLARALSMQGKKDQAAVIYQNLAKTRNYYGFLASMKLKTKLSFENEHVVTSKSILQPYRPFIDQIHTLYISKQTLQASRLLNDFISELPKDHQSALVYWIGHDLKWHGKSVYLSNTKQLNNQLSLRFPLPYQNTVQTYAKNYQIPKELIYAIIRQESGFRNDVVSSAGAHGLMQIMPTTAKSIAKHEKIAYVDKKQLFSIQKNIEIGVAYLRQLKKCYHKNPILVAAAYNAGPKQVNYWLKNDPDNEMDIWIETLPWQETRNYLKNIIAFYAVYQYRMQEKSDLAQFMGHV